MNPAIERKVRAIIRWGLIAAILALLVPTSLPQARAAPITRPFTADVMILKKITITPTAPLSFGKITVGLGLFTNPTVTVAPNNQVTYTGLSLLNTIGVDLVGATVNLGPHRGRVNLTGQPGHVYQIQAPPSITIPFGGLELLVNQFQFLSANAGVAGANPYTAVFSNAGTDTVFLGGKLTLPKIAVNLGPKLTVAVPVTVQYQ